MLMISLLQTITIALLRRWLWVLAPPNPKFSLAGEIGKAAVEAVRQRYFLTVLAGYRPECLGKGN
jgi:hypothetical protein